MIWKTQTASVPRSVQRFNVTAKSASVWRCPWSAHRSSDPGWNRVYLEYGRHRSYRQWKGSPRVRKQKINKESKSWPWKHTYYKTPSIDFFHPCQRPAHWVQTPAWQLQQPKRKGSGYVITCRHHITTGTRWTQRSSPCQIQTFYLYLPQSDSYSTGKHYCLVSPSFGLHLGSDLSNISISHSEVGRTIPLGENASCTVVLKHWK